MGLSVLIYMESCMESCMGGHIIRFLSSHQAIAGELLGPDFNYGSGDGHYYVGDTQVRKPPCRPRSWANSSRF
jgi:hypothetical protein